MTEHQRIFVVDTSALVYDPDLLANARFRHCIIAIPMEVVSELDHLKGDPRNPQTAMHAREVSRRLIDIRNKANGSLRTEAGWRDPDSDISYRIVASSDKDDSVLNTLGSRQSMDRFILQCAKRLATPHKSNGRGSSRTDSSKLGASVVLLTRDINMCLFADGLPGVTAEMYEDLDLHKLIPEGLHRLDVPDSAWQDMFDPSSEERVLMPSVDHTQYQPNEFVLCLHPGDEEKNGVLCRLMQDAKTEERYWVKVNRWGGKLKSGFAPRNIEQEVAFNLITDPSVDLICLSGRAGTGKTFVALAAALQLYDKNKYSGIFITKPVVPIGRDVGFLPGDLDEKMGPWVQSFEDNLVLLTHGKGKLKATPHPAEGRDPEEFSQWNQNGMSPVDMLKRQYNIMVLPVHLARGRTLPRVIIIVDEAQNLSPHEVKTLMTRAGEGAKFILMGDPQQIDSSYLDERTNGLVHAARRMSGLSRVGVVQCTKGERSWLAEQAATRL